MAIYRSKKFCNFTIMSNEHFQEREMSLKAKGMLSLMLSLPDNWKFSEAGLTKLSKDGKASVRNALKELEDFGYLVRHQARTNGAFSKVVYDIYEIVPDRMFDITTFKETNSMDPISKNKTQ